MNPLTWVIPALLNEDAHVTLVEAVDHIAFAASGVTGQMTWTVGAGVGGTYTEQHRPPSIPLRTEIPAPLLMPVR